MEKNAPEPTSNGISLRTYGIIINGIYGWYMGFNYLLSVMHNQEGNAWEMYG